MKRKYFKRKDLNTVKVKIIHPQNNSDVDVLLPKNIYLKDVFLQLTEANFLSPDQEYKGVIKPNKFRKESINLDEEKTVLENRIHNNDIIQIMLAASAGGRADYIVDIWKSIYPYLDQLGTIFGVAGSAISIGSWIKNKFSQKYTPDSFVEYITSKELWNPHELAIKLSISDKEAKDLLKGFGYKKNKKLALYIKTDKTVNVMETIKNLTNSL